MASDLAALIRRTAGNLGIDPSDLGTAMSYETGGRMDPNLWGGKNGKYLGLIQFGPEEQQKYGVKPGMPLDAHFDAVENFLRDRGVKPGMGMVDLYSTINAGSPGLGNRSDAANGGMPGTVEDKVATQMVGHRARANTLLGDENHPIPITPPAQQPQQAPPMSITTPAQDASVAQQQQPDGIKDPTAMLKMLSGALDGGRGQQQQDAPPPPINIAQPAGLPPAQQLARIMQQLSQNQG